MRPKRWMALFVVPVAIFLIAKSLAAFAVIIQPYLRIDYDLRFELGMVIGQVLFQWCVLWRRSWKERFDYALILIAVSALGAALLWPLLLWNRAAPVTPLVAAVAWFFAVVGVMFLAHWQLVKRAGLPLVLCATWVVYRLLLLCVVARRPW